MSMNQPKTRPRNLTRRLRCSPIVTWLEESLTVLPITSTYSAKWISLLALAGSTIALLDSLLFRAHVNFVLNIWLDSIFAAISLLVYKFHRRSSRGLTNSLLGLATIVITIQIAFGYGRDPAILGVVFYIWIALYTFAFLTVLDSLLQVSWIVVSYTIALLLGDKPSAPLADWILTVSTVVIASISAGYLTYTIQKIAITDALTGVNNRKGWEVSSQRERARAIRINCLIVVCVFDLNNFKQINDQKGHHEGDKVLANVGSVLQQALRPFDVIARWGGDEFVLIASVDSVITGQTLITRLYNCGASIAEMCCGSVISSPTVDLEELIRIADNELYKAKNHPTSNCEIQCLVARENHQ